MEANVNAVDFCETVTRRIQDCSAFDTNLVELTESEEAPEGGPAMYIRSSSSSGPPQLQRKL